MILLGSLLKGSLLIVTSLLSTFVSAVPRYTRPHDKQTH